MSYTYTMKAGEGSGKIELSPAAKQVRQAVDSVPVGTKWGSVVEWLDQQPGFPWLESYGFKPETVREMISDDSTLEPVLRDLQEFLFVKEQVAPLNEFKLAVESLPELWNMVVGSNGVASDFWEAFRELKRVRRLASTAQMVKDRMNTSKPESAELPAATGLDQVITGAIKQHGVE